jgi:hypothetical protein
MSRRFFQGLIVGGGLIGIAFGLWMRDINVVMSFALPAVFIGFMTCIPDLD